MGTRANNYTSRINKWKPYLNKPFYLGSVNNADGEDGGKYVIERSVALAGSVFSGTNMKAYCDDEVNSSNAYLIQIHQTTNYTRFLVRKFSKSNMAGSDLNGEDIWASSDSGDGRYWYIGDPSASGTSAFGRWITIDVGVYIQLWGDPDSYGTGDRYILRMPDCKVETISGAKDDRWSEGSEEGVQSMKKRRLYFGGFHSYLQLPTMEGKAFHSDILPTSLKGKSITFTFGKLFETETPTAGWQETLSGCLSHADITGNSAVSVSFEWSVDKDATNSASAGSTLYAWGSGERWPLGNLMVNDADPSDVLNPADRLMRATIPKIDNVASIYTTGSTQPFNVVTFAKGGHAKIKTEFFTGTGSSTTQALNQFWPCTLLIN
jgi:hypothetical protein